MRTQRSGRLCKLHQVWKIRQNLGCKRRRRRIDQGLPWMRRMHGIRKNSLPRMKCVSAFGSGWLLLCGARTWLWLRGANLEQRKIFDRSGPGELSVRESRVFPGTGKLRERHSKKCNVPKSRGKNRAARQPAFNPDISENACG